MSKARVLTPARSAVVVASALALVTVFVFLAPAQNRHLQNRRAVPISILREKAGGEADREGFGPAQEQYDNRAYPRASISNKQVVAARHAFRRVPATSSRGLAPTTGGWQQLGPVIPIVPGLVTYTGAQTTNSGRVTSMVIAPTCTPGNCRVWVGAAGGGVWRTNNALAATPSWKAVDKGLTSNSIGSIVVDPGDSTGSTLYAGTGEPNGSGDSEAGVGLFKSTDGGSS